MRHKTPPIDKARPQIDWAAYWFVRLEEARRDGNHERVSEAQQELARLGYDVELREVTP